MRITILTQNIPDPIRYSFEFVKKIRESISENIDVLLVTDTDKKIQYYDRQININEAKRYALPERITNNHEQSIRKQIAVNRKLGGKFTIKDVIDEHERLYRFYIDLIDKEKPELCIVWNGITHSFQTAFIEACKDLMKPVIYLERGLIPGSIFWDWEGINAVSSVGKDKTWIKKFNKISDPNYFNKIENIIFETGGNIVKEENARGEFNKRNYILFPLQRDSDSNILFNSEYIKNMYQALIFLKELKTKKKIPQDVIFRPHPEDPKNHYTKKIDFSPLICQSNTGLLETIINADLVLTINSTVGFTSLILGKKVVALGKSTYSGRGLCLEPKSLTELQCMLNTKEICISQNIVEQRQEFISKIIGYRHISFKSHELLDVQLNNLKKELTKI
jgi:capsular polysaccharide export protein